MEDQDAPRIWRLSQGASSERRMVSDCISNIQLSNDPDTRVLASMKAEPFSTSGAYRLLQQDTEQQTDIMLLWSTRLPTKVKFFAWLLSHGRLNTRGILVPQVNSEIGRSVLRMLPHCHGNRRAYLHLLPCSSTSLASPGPRRGHPRPTAPLAISFELHAARYGLH